MTEVKELPDAKFGIELELVSDYSVHSVAAGLRKVLADAKIDVDVQEYGNSTSGDIWVVKEDGSCGHEVTTPALTWKNLKGLEPVTAYLNRVGRVNRNCGLHVHHELYNVSLRQLRRVLVYWAVLEPAILAFVKRERSSNEFCLPVLRKFYDTEYNTSESVDQLVQRLRPASRSRLQNVVYGMERYISLNMTPWWNTGRVEVRLHHGTLDFFEIVHWCMFTQLLLKSFRKFTSIETIAAVHPLPLMDKHKKLLDILNTEVPETYRRFLVEGMKYKAKKLHPATLTQLVETVYA